MTPRHCTCGKRVWHSADVCPLCLDALMSGVVLPPLPRNLPPEVAEELRNLTQQEEE